MSRDRANRHHVVPWRASRAPSPDLIPLPERTAKPRISGVTHVVDPGLTRVEAAGLMELAAGHVDIVRLGWGSALVTGALEEKLAVYRDHDVAPMLGGTLTELAWRHGRIDELREALLRLDIHHVEVSEGTLDLPVDDKRRLIAAAARGLHRLRRGRLQGRAPRARRRSCGSGRRARRWTPAPTRSSARAASPATPASTGRTARSATS